MSCCEKETTYQSVLPAPEEHYWHGNGTRGFWSVVKPVGVDMTNEARNPSAEYNLTDWVAIDGAAIGRNAASAMHGGNGVAVTTTTGDQGVGYNYIYMAALDTPYCMCVSVNGPAGHVVSFDVFWPGSPTPPPTTAILLGYPQRLCYSLPPQAATPLVPSILARVRFDRSGVYAVDGLTLTDTDQCLTEYFDGDTPGAEWNGTPHASTSIVSRFSRTYGEVVYLNEIGFNVVSADGWGLAPINNIVTSFARGNGAHLQRQQMSTRTISLVGKIEGGRSGMHRVRKALSDALNYRFKNQCTQELLLRYQLVDECDCPLGFLVEMPVVYAAGLEGSWQNLETERAAIQFQAHREVNWMSQFENVAALTTAGTGGVTQVFTTTVTNEGDEDAWLIFELRTGAGGLVVSSILNSTTNAFVGFIDPVTPANEWILINAGEYYHLRTDPRALSLNHFPDGVRQMYWIRYPDSQLAAMRLVPGDNTFVVDVPFHGTGSLVLVRWHNTYSSIDQTVLCESCQEELL